MPSRLRGPRAYPRSTSPRSATVPPRSLVRPNPPLWEVQSGSRPALTLTRVETSLIAVRSTYRVRWKPSLIIRYRRLRRRIATKTAAGERAPPALGNRRQQQLEQKHVFAAEEPDGGRAPAQLRSLAEQGRAGGKTEAGPDRPRELPHPAGAGRRRGQHVREPAVADAGKAEQTAGTPRGPLLRGAAARPVMIRKQNEQPCLLVINDAFK